jgi:sugar (pentulose or hexulose) kinase
MRLNWGPYQWMRCYNHGAQFLDRVVGSNPDWAAMEAAARRVPPGCGGVGVLPFPFPEPSLGVTAPRVEWTPVAPAEPGVRFRAALEALAYLVALGVRAHASAMATPLTRISVSGGIARSDLMCEILASVLARPVERLVSFEGPALGAAATALAAMETHLRRLRGVQAPYTVADAVAQMVRFRQPVPPNPEWVAAYQRELAAFEAKL